MTAMFTGSSHSAVRFGLSRSPRVAILERDSDKIVDINGDGIPDLNHAETCKKFIQAACPEIKDKDIDIFTTGSSEDPQQQATDTAIKLAELAQKANNGDVYDTLSISEGLPFQYFQDKTPQNLKDHREELLEGFSSHHPAFGFVAFALAKFKEDFGTISFAAAGNKKPDENNKTFSLLSLVENIINVGATNKRGEKEPYSTDNSLIHRWEQGSFLSRKMKGGYDITGDGKLDVLDSEITASDKEPFVNRFVGKKVEDVVVTHELVQQKGLSHEDALNNYLFPDDEGGYFSFILDPQTHEPKGLFKGFQAKGGKIIYDPENTGEHQPNAVNYLKGTSFANAFAAGKDTHQRICVPAKA